MHVITIQQQAIVQHQLPVNYVILLDYQNLHVYLILMVLVVIKIINVTFLALIQVWNAPLEILLLVCMEI